ncbi:MAG: C40 family peptidase [Dechloromonas sp.]|jgi:cell wall-associated NlpC family hydrolase|nr:C40 family peptidase [Xanthomonadales bacterium]QLQ23940.1 MAG: C40 family peptidase [Dechloromonas sp.]
MRHRVLFVVLLAMSLLTACGSPASRPATFGGTIAHPLPVSAKGNEVALYALGLIDTGYRFGGRNPEAGLDCSGMVSFIYGQATGLKVTGSAADIARNSRPIEPEFLRPGDLVFFNTRNQPYSHVGIYLGDSRFVHAPATSGRVRIDRLSDRYYAQRFEAARTFFD